MAIVFFDRCAFIWTPIQCIRGATVEAPTRRSRLSVLLFNIIHQNHWWCCLFRFGLVASLLSCVRLCVGFNSCPAFAYVDAWRNAFFRTRVNFYYFIVCNITLSPNFECQTKGKHSRNIGWKFYVPYYPVSAQGTYASHFRWAIIEMLKNSAKDCYVLN